MDSYEFKTYIEELLSKRRRIKVDRRNE